MVSYRPDHHCCRISCAGLYLDLDLQSLYLLSGGGKSLCEHSPVHPTRRPPVDPAHVKNKNFGSAFGWCCVMVVWAVFRECHELLAGICWVQKGLSASRCERSLLVWQLPAKRPATPTPVRFEPNPAGTEDFCDSWRYSLGQCDLHTCASLVP